MGKQEAATAEVEEVLNHFKHEFTEQRAEKSGFLTGQRIDPKTGRPVARSARDSGESARLGSEGRGGGGAGGRGEKKEDGRGSEGGRGTATEEGRGKATEEGRGKATEEGRGKATEEGRGGTVDRREAEYHEEKPVEEGKGDEAAGGAECGKVMSVTDGN